MFSVFPYVYPFPRKTTKYDVTNFMPKGLPTSNQNSTCQKGCQHRIRIQHAVNIIPVLRRNCVIDGLRRQRCDVCPRYTQSKTRNDGFRSNLTDAFAERAGDPSRLVRVLDLQVEPRHVVLKRQIKDSLLNNRRVFSSYKYIRTGQRHRNAQHQEIGQQHIF